MVKQNAEIAAWMKAKNLDADAVKDLIGVKSVSTIYRYLNKERMPSRAIMQKLREVSDGMVTAESFYA